MLRELLHRFAGWFAGRGRPAAVTAAPGGGLDPVGLPNKASADDYPGRFREILADPLNLLITRDPRAGVVENGHVYLHNGNRVAVSGPLSYYGRFSEILVLNRGVHEPLEEFVFQELLRVLPRDAVMLELGAYWGHYSMWLKRAIPGARAFLVEPSAEHIAVGRENFLINRHEGVFIEDKVCADRFTVDRFLADHGIERLDVLHADIQRWEVEMLDGATEALSDGRIGYVFVSTHSAELHEQVRDRLVAVGYVIEADSDFARGTTSFDGLVFARASDATPVVPALDPLGRLEIATAGPSDLVRYLQRVVAQRS